MSYKKLEEHRRIWKKKRLLRSLYHGWYKEIGRYIEERRPVLEIGAGGGNMTEFFPDMISSDYIFCPWLDLNLDAHELPIKTDSLGAIVAIDVLHHLAEPILFLQEARRSLVKQGRLIMLEPFISPWSFPIYRFLHPEDVDLSWDPFLPRRGQREKKPFEGNMAIASILFWRNKKKLKRYLPDLQVIKIHFSDFFLYPLSGGFDHPSLCPDMLASSVRHLERLARPAARFLAYRMLIVMERRSR